MNKEFYNMLNKIEYSDNEINDYIEASGLTDEEESVERIIKFRDIESLEDITVSSFMRATTLGWINNEDIIGTKFTTKRVVFNRKDPSKIRFSRWTKGVIASQGLLLLNIISILFSNKISAEVSW